MIRRAVSLVVAALVAGCVAGPDYERPEPPVSAAVEDGRFLRAGEASSEIPSLRWWEALGDPVLSRLIEQGLANAPAVEVARARVRQSREAVVAAGADRLPAIAGSAIYARADLPADAIGGASGDIELVNLGFDAQWEADLAGSKRRALEQSIADAGAAEARFADAQVSLSAEIARSYALLRAEQAKLALLDERMALETRVRTLEQQRFTRGTIPRQPVEAARMALSRTRSERAGAMAQATILEDSLAVLTGLAPGEGDGIEPGAVPLPPAVVAIGDPGAMLARRPDVRAAERRLAASNAAIGVAEARRYPQISLTGLIGIGGDSIGDVFDSSRLSAIALPRLSWNFLDFGRTAAAVRGAEAGKDGALAEYRASMLEALRDAENALTRFGLARAGLAEAAQRTGHARTIAGLETKRAAAGTISQRAAIDAQLHVVGLQIAQAEGSANLTVAYVALCKALGLGWQADGDVAAAPD